MTIYDLRLMIYEVGERRFLLHESLISDISDHKSGSKPLGDSSLLEDSVGCVARLDLLINDKPKLRDWTEPDLMVAFALSLETSGRDPAIVS